MNTDQKILFLQKLISEKQEELNELIKERDNKIKLQSIKQTENIINKFLSKYFIIDKKKYNSLSPSGKEKCRMKKRDLYNEFKGHYPSISSKIFHKTLIDKVNTIQNKGTHYYILSKIDINKKCDKCGLTLYASHHTPSICDLTSSLKHE